MDKTHDSVKLAKIMKRNGIAGLVIMMVLPICVEYFRSTPGLYYALMVGAIAGVQLGIGVWVLSQKRGSRL